MKKLLHAVAVAGALAPSLVHAQVKIDMGRVTCGEYLEMPSDISVDFSAWMSGWMNQKNGKTTIDMGAFQKNIQSVKDWCNSHKTESVMTGLYAATGTKN